MSEGNGVEEPTVDVRQFTCLPCDGRGIFIGPVDIIKGKVTREYFGCQHCEGNGIMLGKINRELKRLAG